jgi:heptosyltransferase-1
LRTFPLPPGRPEGRLPSGDFVLASPLAGWGAKQWPLEFYGELGQRLRHEFGLKLVLNAAESVEVVGADPHASGLPGLVDATRRATAVVGVDSGPLHLAAALGKSGVAIYGPTDPARNGPYGGTFTVLRSPDAFTTLKRTPDPHSSMRAISPATVFEALAKVLCSRSVTPTL